MLPDLVPGTVEIKEKMGSDGAYIIYLRFIVSKVQFIRDYQSYVLFFRSHKNQLAASNSVKTKRLANKTKILIN